MKKLSLAALLVILSACNRPQQVEGEAIYAKVVLSPSVSATCVLFEVRDVEHRVLQNKWLHRDDDELQIVIFRGELPQDVELAARPYLDGDCHNDTTARTHNGPFQTVTASFVVGKVPDPVSLELKPGTDGDGDEYVSVGTGGLDCRDGPGEDGINPGEAETCQLQVDLNCDGKRGCETEGCAPNACIGPPDNLALTVPAKVPSGDCTAASIQVKDDKGSNTTASAAISVVLQATPGIGATFYADAQCTTARSTVNIETNERQAAFYFRGQIVGNVTLTATATGLKPGSATVGVELGTGNQLVFLSPQRTPVAGACSQAVQLQSQNAQGTAVPAPVATTVQLQSDSADPNFRFYRDGSCATAVTSVDLIAGVTTASFYFRGTQAGAVRVTVAALNYTGSSQVQTIMAGPPSAVAFTGPDTAQAGSCTAFTAELRDAHGNPTTTAASRTVNLSATLGVTFSTSPTCSPSTSSLTIPAAGGSVGFFARGTQVGNPTLTGTATNLSNATRTLAITPGPATVLFFTTGAQTVQAGSCSPAAATVQLRDAHGNPVTAASAMTVGLAAAPGQDFQFFAGAGCGGSAVMEVPLAAGANSASFSFRGTRAGAVTMTASSGALSVNQVATINPAPPSVLAFPQSPLMVTAGACTQVTLQVRDAHGNPSPVSGTPSMGLAASPTGGFTISSRADCGNTISGVTFNSGQNSATFHVRGTVTGSVTVTATGTGLDPGSLTLTVNAAAPNKLAFQPPAQTIEMGACSGITTVQVQDTHSNVTSVGTNTQVNLTSAPANTTFYTDANCTAQAVTSVMIPTGGNSASFRFKSSTAGTVTLTAASSGLISGNQQQTLTQPPPTELVFTTNEQTRSAGLCSGAVTVQARAQGVPVNVSANTPVTLAASPTENFTFYSDAGCNTAVGQVTITTGQDDVNFYFRGTQVGTVIITASSTGLISADQNAIITAAAPNKLRFTTPAHMTTAATCSAAVTVQVTDTHNNPSAVAGNTLLTLNRSGNPADNEFQFYAEPNCTTVVTTRTIPTGQTEVSFYYRGVVAREVDIAVSATGLAATPVQRHTITALNATALVFSPSTPTGAVLAGTCTLRTVESRDVHGNPARNALTVALSASPQADLFLDSSCTTPTNQISIAQGSNSAAFYFKGIKGGINATAFLDLTASSTGLTPVTRRENIIPTVRSGSCSLPGNAPSGVCAIAPALASVNKTFLVFQATNPSVAGESTNIRCFLSSVSQVTCERGDNKGGDVNIQWSVAELPANVVDVQHHSVPCDNNISPVGINPAVIRDRTFLLLSSRRDSVDQASTMPRLAELTSTTEAEIRKMGGCAEDDTNHLQVVSYTGATVQRGVTDLQTGTSKQINLAPGVAPDRSILLYSYISDGSGNKICDRVLRGALSIDGANVNFSRGEGDAVNCASSQFTAISWEVVQFPVGTFVQQLTQQLTGTTATITLPTQVDASRTLVFAGGQWASGQALGEGRYAGGEIIGEMRARATLSSDGTTVTLTRDSANASATFTVFVVQLKP